MRLNIPKLYNGGLGTLFSTKSLAALQPEKPAMSPTGGVDSEGPEILSKELLNKLRGATQGLPNESKIFELELAKLEDELNRGLVPDYKRIADIRTKATTLISHAGFLAKAEEHIVNQEAMGDVAVDHKGFIYAINQKGEVQKVPFAKFNRQKHQALTYGELIELRRESPQLINDTDVMTTINRGIGTTKINSFIQDILSKVGSAENKQEAYELLSTLKGSKAQQLPTADYLAIKDLATIANQVGVDMLFKTTRVSNDPNLQHALEYIYNLMPANMRAQLQGNYIADGGEYEKSGEYIGEMLRSAALMRRNTTFGIDYQEGINTAAGTSSKDPSGKTYYQNPIEALFVGDLNQDKVLLSDPTSNNQYGIELNAVLGGPLTVLNGEKPVRDMPMHIAIEQSVSPMLDTSKTYVGEQKIPIEKLQGILYTNADTQVVYMPTDGEGNIAWEAIQAYSRAEQACRQQGITDPRQKNIRHAAEGSCIQYTEDGKQVIRQGYSLQPYFKTHGYTNDDFFPGFWNEGAPIWSTKLQGQEESAVRDRIKNIESKGNRKAGNFDKIGLNWHDAVYRVPIYIKVDANAETIARTYSGHGPLEPGRSNSTFMQAQQSQVIQNTNPSLLN